MKEPEPIYTIADHIRLWVENGNVILIQTVEPHGAPVDIGENEAQELLDLLTKLIDEIR